MLTAIKAHAARTIKMQMAFAIMVLVARFMALAFLVVLPNVMTRV